MCHLVKGVGNIQENDIELFHVSSALGKILDGTGKFLDTRSLFKESISPFTSYLISCSLTKSNNRLLRVSGTSLMVTLVNFSSLDLVNGLMS